MSQRPGCQAVLIGYPTSAESVVNRVHRPEPEVRLGVSVEELDLEQLGLVQPLADSESRSDPS